MYDNLFIFLIFFLGIFAVYTICCTACEYRNYSMGHRFVNAFAARNEFQKMFTVLQRTADIDRWDMKKITYAGYTTVVICTVTAVVVIPFTIIMYFFDKSTSVLTFLYWWGGCILLALIAYLLQLFDSFLNFLLEVAGY